MPTIQRIGTFFLVFSMAVLLGQCIHGTDDNHSHDMEDTTRIIQTVLADRLLEFELLKDFGDQQLNLISGSVVKPNQQFIFLGKLVKIVQSKGNIYQFHEQHPKGLYASVLGVKFISKDSATVQLIFHAGNATAFFHLKDNKGIWVISDRQYGKF